LSTSNEVEFIASHFSELSIPTLSLLSIENLSEILSSASLNLRSEDLLYELLISCIERSIDSFVLFEFVHFENLSTSNVQLFISLSERYFDHFTLAIWTRVSVRVVQPHGSAIKRMVNGQEFRCDLSQPFSGIFSYLSQKYGGNVDGKGIVSVTASSVHGSQYAPKYSVDMNLQTEFGSKTLPNQWICYDFKDK
jgi:hypothetical protein